MKNCSKAKKRFQTNKWQEIDTSKHKAVNVGQDL
jgi:hypothetical protein